MSVPVNVVMAALFRPVEFMCKQDANPTQDFHVWLVITCSFTTTTLNISYSLCI